MQPYSYLLFNFWTYLDLTHNFLIRINQVFHWFNNDKKQYATEVKRSLNGVFTSLNTTETLWFHGGIITMENIRYYIFYLKRAWKKTWIFYHFLFKNVVYCGKMSPFWSIGERKTISTFYYHTHRVYWKLDETNKRRYEKLLLL